MSRFVRASILSSASLTTLAGCARPSADELLGPNGANDWGDWAAHVVQLAGDAGDAATQVCAGRDPLSQALCASQCTAPSDPLAQLLCGRWQDGGVGGFGAPFGRAPAMAAPAAAHEAGVEDAGVVLDAGPGLANDASDASDARDASDAGETTSSPQ